MHKTTKSTKGTTIASRCAAVIRGGKNPLVALLTSNCAETFGVVVPIPVWEKVVAVNNKVAKIVNSYFINDIVLF